MVEMVPETTVMLTDDPSGTERLTTLIRSKGRWPSLAVPLLEAIEAESWRKEGFPSPTAWLDRMAALGGRSTTYLSRCVSAGRFIKELSATFPSHNFSLLWKRPLSAIEAFRRQTGGDFALIEQHLPQLSSGALTSYGTRQGSPAQSRTSGKAERMGFEEIVLKALALLLPEMNYSEDTNILVEPRTPVGRPDIVLIDRKMVSTTILEVKSSLSRRKQNDIVQQLLAYASLVNKVWLILPSDSNVPGEIIINSLRRAAVNHVGLLLLDPSSSKVTQVIPPESEADATDVRTSFRNLALASQRMGA